MEQHDAVYTMAVAARLSGMHPQTLRKYERAGLLRPARQAGNQRLYSNADIRRLHRIQYLVDVRGLNIAGLALVFAMIDRLAAAGVDATQAALRTAVDEALEMSLEPDRVGEEPAASGDERR